jgi:diguanylate cyclase (GGDEF)-like protein/PAS domain S-box-containing protein
MSSSSLRNLVSGIGLFVAVFTALVIPTGYFLTNYYNKAGVTQYKADLGAVPLAQYIYSNNALWEYQELRLAELLEVIDRTGEEIHKRIVDSHGTTVLDEGADLAAPTLVRSAPIVVSGATVGRIEIATSLQWLLVETALISILSGLFGYGVYFAMRILPLRVLDRTLDNLADANRTIEERNRLLHQQNDRLVAHEQELQKQNRRFDAALNNMAQGLCMFDKDARLVVCNQRYLTMYGLSPDIVKPGCTLQELAEHRKSRGSYFGDAEEYIQSVRRALAAGESITKALEIDDGRVMAVATNPMSDGGWVATHEDITARRQAEEKIHFMARHDALTKLPNRLEFQEELEKALVNAQRGESLGVLCLDLDRFKQANDTLGHPVGDRLLQAVAVRLQNCLRDGDVVSRFGGDEFSILQRNVEQPNGATALATRLIEVLDKSFDIDGNQVNIGVSIGISIAPADGTDVERLLRNADLALYRAKADGKGTFRFFEQAMDARMQARSKLEHDLRKGIVNKEFELYYQPVITLDTQKISGFEALLRWNHPERGLVLPGDFIPLAEEVGLIVPLGEWVLREACHQAAKWPNDIHVAVNLSPAQFKSRNIEQVVFSALAHSGLTPQRLELEITESVLLNEEEATLATLHKLRAFGVGIAMDDFGTGYSSLAYLRSFPFDKIKIDQSFIADLLTRKDSLAIVRAVTGLGTSLGMSITAEGVETVPQLERLKKEGCTEVQGYLFSPPRPASELAEMIDSMGPAARRVA